MKFKRYPPNSLTPIYDFSPDGYEDILTTTFDKEVYITFKVDPTQVKNWDHVEINDFDNGDFEIKTINKNEGFITISTKTLGTYNVMEVEPNEDETVTDVVYNVYADFSDKVVDEKTNEIVLDYTNKYVDTDKLSVTFTPAQIETVYQQQKNAKVVVKDKYVSTKLPVSLLKSNDRVTFVTVPKFDQEGALCPVIDFTIVTADGQKITNFEEIPITLTFLINPILVKDWNDVKVVYLDENGQMKEFLTPTSVDKVNGYVTVDVTHFSTYGVFEVASADTETPDNTEEGTKDDAPSNNDSGKKLPATATEDYNLLASGLLLIVVSGVIFFVLNRRRVNNI